MLSIIPSLLVSTCVYHLDCTYKLTKNRFPLCVFGVSDFSGQLHPIAFALLSHEREGDFEWFFRSLISLTDSLGIVLNPKFLMMDACDASWNAASKIFPDTSILMCYFHVKFNVKKHSKLLPKDALDSVNVDIDSMHKTLTVEHFVQQRDSVMEKWTQLGYVEFRDYFIKEWLCEKFWRWQFFQVPCGLATTNSTIESYNKIIKLLYTNYISYSVYEIFNVILDKLVSYNSVQPKEFLYYREPNKKMKDKYKSLSKDLIIEVSPTLFNYDNKYSLTFEKHNIYRLFHYISCNCLCFYNVYVCKHVLLLADKLNLRLKGF